MTLGTDILHVNANGSYFILPVSVQIIFRISEVREL